jgi:hypothetical protein
MDWGGPGFVLTIIALSYLAWIVTTWVRAKHGYPLENEWGGKVQKGDGASAKALEAKVEKLTEEVEHYRDRVRVLERIVTDGGFVTAAQIEALRNEESSGVPLELGRKENV